VRIVFLGTPSFAVPTLERLAQSRHKILTVLTQPDRPRDRGLTLTPPPVKAAASALNLPIIQPDKASSPQVVEKMHSLAPDAAVVVAYGQILKRNFLFIPRYGCINLHASLLPKYRGPSPIQAAILAGDKETGVTTMLLDEKMDTGQILLQRSIEIAEEDTAGTLHDKLADIGASLMVETLDKLERGEISPKRQDDTKATLTHKITKNDAKIDWRQPAEKIYNQVRAFNPWPGCETSLDGLILKIWKSAPAGKPEKAGEPGEVLIAEGEDLIIRAEDGSIRVLELQLAGGKRMRTQEFLRGHPIQPGAILGT
jgi:methionyl-tRNA formyltransferase